MRTQLQVLLVTVAVFVVLLLPGDEDRLVTMLQGLWTYLLFLIVWNTSK